jgi:hypothetical protein
MAAAVESLPEPEPEPEPEHVGEHAGVSADAKAAEFTVENLGEMEVAIDDNDLDTVRALLDAGFSPDADIDGGETPLHVAGRDDRVEVAELLLARGADPEMRDEDGWTPLIQSCYWNARRTAAALLLAGADPAARDKEGRDGVELAEKGHHLATAALLRPVSAAAEAQGWAQMPAAARLAAARLAVEGAGPAVAAAVALQTMIDEQREPMKDAAEHGDVATLAALLDADFPIDAWVSDKTGSMALHVAAANDQVEAVELLTSRGAPLECRRNNAWTPFMAAVIFRKPKAARVLLEAGADPASADEDGR